MGIKENDKVLIIDDQYEEITPIINALSTKGIFTVYWNGGFETKPNKPMEGIRFVFLDMRFSAITDSHTINSNLFTLLKSAISIKNGPYILLIWSKHDNEYLEEFKKELNQIKDIPKPYLIVNMEKNNFIQWEYEKNEVYDEIAATLEENYEIKNELLEILQNNNINRTNEVIRIKENVIEELLESLDKKLKEINSLDILLLWERIISISAQKIVNEISSFSEVDKEWDNNIKMLIQNLAIANAGKGIEETAKSYIINALFTLNQMLPDEIWNEINEIEIKEEEFEFMKIPSITKIIEEDRYSISKIKNKFLIKKNKSDYISFKNLESIGDEVDKQLCEELYKRYIGVLGKSNFKLLCERGVSNQIKKPGNVYKLNDSDLLSKLSWAILKECNDENLENVELILLDISSACDYAQNKLKRIRILPGLIIKENNFKNIIDMDDIFCTPELEIDNMIVKVVFNFHYISNYSESDLDNIKIHFSFRELLLLELKHKLSAYISRVGIVNL